MYAKTPVRKHPNTPSRIPPFTSQTLLLKIVKDAEIGIVLLDNTAFRKDDD